MICRACCGSPPGTDLAHRSGAAGTLASALLAKQPLRNGTTHVVLEPLAPKTWMQRLLPLFAGEIPDAPLGDRSNAFLVVIGRLQPLLFGPFLVGLLTYLLGEPLAHGRTYGQQR